MFNFDSNTCAITMHAGDTGSKWIHATRESGEPWTEDDRCLFTVTDANGVIVMQRIYRLDDQWGAGNGYFLMEFHNNDTDTWVTGQYTTEWRYDVDPSWLLGPEPTGRVTNTMIDGAVAIRMTDGAVVRTKVRSTLQILPVSGLI